MDSNEDEKARLKESFQNVKKDIDLLNSDLFGLKEDISDMKQDIAKVCDILEKISSTLMKNGGEIRAKPELTPFLNSTDNPTNRHINQTTPTHFPTHNWPLNPPKAQNKVFSTGNQGVPTDRQTDQQTDNSFKIRQKTQSQQPVFSQNQYGVSPIEDAAKILDSLDSLKKEIRLKFKSLTDQEILVFSTLYQLEEEQGPVEYKVLAQNLKLTESSVRDYIGRLLKKGIPIDKSKLNNKQVQLSISQSLKKVASLSTILQLRGI